MLPTKRCICLLLLSVLLVLTGLSCGRKAERPIDRNTMDLSVEPGEDFFRYANGGWLDRNEIPDDKTSYSTFDVLREDRDAALRDLLEEVARVNEAEKGSIEQKIRDFYGVAMDVKKIEADGLKPLKPEFDRIDAIETAEDVQDAVAYFHTIGLDPVFGGGLEQDLMNSEIYKFYLMQAGLGLPDVEYYTKSDERSQEIREEYVKHVAAMFRLMGDDASTADVNAGTVMKIEKRLAGNSRTRLQMRNIPALYNRHSMAQLRRLAPRIDWDRYFTNISDTDFGDIIVGMPEFFEEVNALMQDVSVEDWKTYLRWNVISNLAGYLSEDFVNQNYRFYSEFLSGSKKIPDRWKRVTQTTSSLLGEPLGQLYVEKHFPPEAKARMLDLVANLKKAMKVRIEKLEWMGEATKMQALDKLEAMRFKIGYPDKWKDFSKLEIERDAYVRNVLRANRFHYYRNLDKFGKPVDLEEWGMTPQTVNAGYHPLKNEMTFPAGILQPPFFYMTADDAVNYGAIGVVIGHEMTHGFDDQGRHFDKEGNMRDWWKKEDADEFNARTERLVEQYDAFVAIGDVHINGKLTLGENIADFGGLSIALHAYRMSLEGRPDPESIDGFTDRQRFFLAYAQIWRGKIRDEALMRRCQEDVHPWGKFRVNGALFNVPEFYAAFEIDEDDPLYRSPGKRPIIW